MSNTLIRQLQGKCYRCRISRKGTLRIRFGYVNTLCHILAYPYDELKMSFNGNLK